MRAIGLLMEAASTSETSVNFYQTTRRNNAEDSHLQADSRLSSQEIPRLFWNQTIYNSPLPFKSFPLYDSQTTS
jgi:hypothetical protein